MNSLNTTDLSREDNWDMPDNPETSKEAIAFAFTSLMFGILLGVSATFFYCSYFTHCIAGKYCSEHGVKKMSYGTR